MTEEERQAIINVIEVIQDTVTPESHEEGKLYRAKQTFKAGMSQMKSYELHIE